MVIQKQDGVSRNGLGSISVQWFSSSLGCMIIADSAACLVNQSSITIFIVCLRSL